MNDEFSIVPCVWYNQYAVATLVKRSGIILLYSLPMGFAQLAITDLASEYHLSVEEVFRYCDQLGITYKNQDTCLALEDAKAVIQHILSQNSQSSGISRDKNLTEYQN